jgi:succinylarginine dihydrolase
MVHGTSALLVLATLALGPMWALAQETLEIGFFAPLTGFAAADGASTRHSAEIAVAELRSPSSACSSWVASARTAAPSSAP